MSRRPPHADISAAHALDLLREAPHIVTDTSRGPVSPLRGYVGGILDRLSTYAARWVARELGVRNPAMARPRLERQIMEVL